MATAHLSTGWAGRRARGTAQVQGRWAQAGRVAGTQAAGRAGAGVLGGTGAQQARGARLGARGRSDTGARGRGRRAA